jgi:hypothetical protein
MAKIGLVITENMETGALGELVIPNLEISRASIFHTHLLVSVSLLTQGVCKPGIGGSRL